MNSGCGEDGLVGTFGVAAASKQTIFLQSETMPHGDIWIVMHALHTGKKNESTFRADSLFMLGRFLSGKHREEASSCLR
jgi:hypothetical protein